MDPRPRETVRAPDRPGEASATQLSTGTVDKLGTSVDDTRVGVYTPWNGLWKPDRAKLGRAL